MTTRSYEQVGVRGQGDALSSVSRHLGPTLKLPRGAEVLTRFGHYASVLKVSDELAVAVSTDGVGSKTIIASALDRYETIGFDCMAMNVNDVICVGARPVALVDYLGVNTLDDRRTNAILGGLAAAAVEAGVAIPGGEIAQLPEVIGSDGRSPGDQTAFDLVGTCVGTVHPERLVLGRAVEPGDAIIGIASSGIHSNGLTLARRALFEGGGYALGDQIPALGRTLGEELLEPTAIYVRAVVGLWENGIETRGLVHMTSDGFANLCRLDAPVGYEIEELPDAPPIFTLIQRAGEIEDSEMYRVFNMGIGFVVVVPEPAGEDAIAVLGDGGYRAMRIGRVSNQEGLVHIRPRGLEGSLAEGESVFRPTR
ncbi:MAG TPA: phosphoribosylformylglycinamidine cyclo-ligase [Actinomycetota bacterium]|nr:phosphoribosylformylglycinamidine cyclo-ligase [Actinomycetota bacterium]